MFREMVTDEYVRYLTEDALEFEVWGSTGTTKGGRVRPMTALVGSGGGPGKSSHGMGGGLGAIMEGEDDEEEWEFEDSDMSNGEAGAGVDDGASSNKEGNDVAVASLKKQLGSKNANELRHMLVEAEVEKSRLSSQVKELEAELAKKKSKICTIL